MNWIQLSAENIGYTQLGIVILFIQLMQGGGK